MNESANPFVRDERFVLRLCLVLVFATACDNKTKTPEGYQGIVELDERTLAFEVGGKLLEVAVKKGDMVAPGTLLARLDSTLPSLELQALEAQAEATKAELDLLYEGARPEEIEQARARVSAADAAFRTSQREYDRAQTLFESATLPEQRLDETRLRLDQARAAKDEATQRLKELRRGPRAPEIAAGEARLDAAKSSAESARERIRRHELFADSHAEILDVPRRFGEYVAPGTTVVTVADTTRPYVDVFVPQKEIAALKVGEPVTIRVDALDSPLGGRVEHVARAMEYSPRFLFSPAERPYLVLRVRVRIQDDERRVHAGIPAFVTLGAAAGLSLPDAPSTEAEAAARPADTMHPDQPEGKSPGTTTTEQATDPEDGTRPRKTKKKARKP